MTQTERYTHRATTVVDLGDGRKVTTGRTRRFGPEKSAFRISKEINEMFSLSTKVDKQEVANQLNEYIKGESRRAWFGPKIPWVGHNLWLQGGAISLFFFSLINLPVFITAEVFLGAKLIKDGLKRDKLRRTAAEYDQNLLSAAIMSLDSTGGKRVRFLEGIRQKYGKDNKKT